MYNPVKKKTVNSVHSYSPTAYLKDASFDFYPDTAFVIDGEPVTNQQHLNTGYANGNFTNQ